MTDHRETATYVGFGRVGQMEIRQGKNGCGALALRADPDIMDGCDRVRSLLPS